MPIQGIVASGISKSKIATGSFYSIATVTLGSSSATISFSSIPSTYKHIQIRFSALFASGGNVASMQFNSDTATNYSWHNIYSGNSTIGAQGSANATSIRVTPQLYGEVATYPNVSIIDIIDYANTTKYKTMRSIAGSNDNTTTQSGIDLFSGSWRSTSAITSIDITNASVNFQSGSTFALYGIN